MNWNINDFIGITRYKNGRVRITHDISNEANIYKLLKEAGFGFSKIGNKRVYFRKKEQSFDHVGFWELRDYFSDFLKKTMFVDIPTDISREDILNWCYSKSPIKRNGLFDHYLSVELSKNEEHELRLKTDSEYAHKHEVKNLLSKFNSWSFDSTEDKTGYFSREGTPLYFKRFDGNNYLIFVHYNSQRPTLDGFDFYIATYESEQHFNKMKPLKSKDIRLRFRLDRDYNLIEQYLGSSVENGSR